MAVFLTKQNGKGVKKVRGRIGGNKSPEGRRQFVEVGMLSHRRHLVERELLADVLSPAALVEAFDDVQATSLCPVTGEPMPANGTGCVQTVTDDGEILFVHYEGGKIRGAQFRSPRRR